VGAGFYLGLGKHVADGTVCDEAGEKVCIAGECKVCNGATCSSVYSGLDFITKDLPSVLINPNQC